MSIKRKYSREEVWQHMSGRVYINRDDTNIFVKRKSFGSWTMNLGNKWSWVIIGVELVVITAILWMIL